jgi:hypothetical protein
VAQRTHRALVALTVVVLACAGIAVGARQLWRAAQSVSKSDGCDFGTYNLDTGQAQIASTIVGVVLKRGLPERAAVLTIGAALQESKLRNLPAGQGDRDSVGILQQRPSQGWGTAEQIADVQYASGKFLDSVVKVPNWQSDSLATVVQAVQFSADGAAYAKHEPEAQEIADALSGAKQAVIAAVTKDLPVSTPTASGPKVSVGGAGWATAAWFICNADRLGIDSVQYGGNTWSRAKGWHADPSSGTSAVLATLAKSG